MGDVVCHDPVTVNSIRPGFGPVARGRPPAFDQGVAREIHVTHALGHEQIAIRMHGRVEKGLHARILRPLPGSQRRGVQPWNSQCRYVVTRRDLRQA